MTDQRISVASVSGGRSSAMMVAEHLASGGSYDHLLFANTGLESPETYEFLEWCDRHLFGNRLVCLERQADGSCKVLGFGDLNRDGKPLSHLILEQHRKMPNMFSRFCTLDLKRNLIHSYLYDRHGRDVRIDMHIGFRADEAPGRVTRTRQRNEAFETRDNDGKRPLKYTSYRVLPLVDRGITRRDVLDYWRRLAPPLSFDPADPGTQLSNCVGCFFGNVADKVRVVRERPWYAAYWEHLERNIPRPPTAVAPRRRRFILKELNREPTAADALSRNAAVDHAWADVRELIDRGGTSLLLDEPAHAGGCDDGWCNTD